MEWVLKIMKKIINDDRIIIGEVNIKKKTPKILFIFYIHYQKHFYLFEFLIHKFLSNVFF